jgi:hypothetical protein
MRIKIRAFILGLLGVALIISGCSSHWEYPLRGLPAGEVQISKHTWEDYSDFADEEGQIPLEQVLYGLGARIIDAIEITEDDGNVQRYDWGPVAESALLRKNGQITIEGEELQPLSVQVEVSPWESQVEGYIYDIAPTAAGALGLPAPELASGSKLANVNAKAVLLLFLDGFGYIRYQEALEEGLIPRLAELDPPLVGMTTYPPITTVSTASLLTGTEPQWHGVEVRGVRKTDQQTLFDVAGDAGLRVVAVEGEALAFNLPGVELQLSGDRDGNGGTDDNVLVNTLAVLEEGMPDVLLVHFHGIDDQGHTVGPGGEDEKAKIKEVDAAVGEILDRLPPGTLVMIFADHGMHSVSEEGRLGNHGQLTARDMLIPIWIELIGD